MLETMVEGVVEVAYSLFCSVLGTGSSVSSGRVGLGLQRRS